MPHPPIVYLISAHCLWLQACGQVLRNFAKQMEVVPVLADDGLSSMVERVVATGAVPDLVVVLLDVSDGDLRLIRAIRRAGYRGPLMVLCSGYATPTKEVLAAENVQDVVSSVQSLEELEASIYAQLERQGELRIKQHSRVARIRNPQALPRLLSEREKEILRLVAEDMTDKEIAERLSISTRTVNLHLRHIYAKLGVKGRAGATAVAIIKGVI